MRYGQFAAIGVLVCIGFPASAQFYDSSSLTFNGLSSVAGSLTFATRISVASDTLISSFAMENRVYDPGFIKFFIFDDTTSTFVYTSSARAVGSEASLTFKQSDPLNMTLLASDHYYFGMISDQATDIPYRDPATPFSQGGVSSDLVTRTFNNFSTPIPNGFLPNNSDQPLQLFGAAATTPEPGVLGLLSGLSVMGSLVTIRLRGRRKQRVSRE